MVERIGKIIRGQEKELASLYPHELQQVVSDAKIVESVGAIMVAIALPVLAGSVVAGFLLNNPSAESTVDSYGRALAIDTAVILGSATVMYLGLKMTEIGDRILRIVPSPQKQGINSTPNSSN